MNRDDEEMDDLTDELLVPYVKGSRRHKNLTFNYSKLVLLDQNQKLLFAHIDF